MKGLEKESEVTGVRLPIGNQIPMSCSGHDSGWQYVRREDQRERRGGQVVKRWRIRGERPRQEGKTET